MGNIGPRSLRLDILRKEWSRNTPVPRPSLVLAMLVPFRNEPSPSRNKLPLDTRFTPCPVTVILQRWLVPAPPRTVAVSDLPVSSNLKKQATAPTAILLAVETNLVPVLVQCMGLTWWPYPKAPILKIGRANLRSMGIDTNRPVFLEFSRPRQLSEEASDSPFFAN